jgi:hypothetical protein
VFSKTAYDFPCNGERVSIARAGSLEFHAADTRPQNQALAYSSPRFSLHPIIRKGASSNSGVTSGPSGCLVYVWARQIAIIVSGFQNLRSADTILNVGTEKRREKVVVLRELQRAIIYTRELSKQVIEDHVSTVFTVYSVNEGARLTLNT